MAGQNAHLLVFGNEKGGTGKSTTAMHAAIALAVAGRRVAVIDLDTRQKTVARYLENRATYARRHKLELVQPPVRVFDEAEVDAFDAHLAELQAMNDVVVIDTPGRDSALGRRALTRADTLVTPINDSFVDLDLMGNVDPDTYKVTRPSFYAELVWDSRKARARSDGGTVDWIVLRNRLASLESRNLRRVGAALGELSKRIGFRVIPGLSERVIYRELFPQGLTLLDLGEIQGAGLSHVAARQELRELVGGLALPDPQAQPLQAVVNA
jgi:chromosome partitioning protein